MFIHSPYFYLCIQNFIPFMETLLHYLAERPLILLFLIIGFGFLLSHIKIKGVGFGVAFVLFTGLAFGAWGKDLFDSPELIERMEMIGQIGLMLFVYTIGLQAGPAFFRILKQKGLYIALLGIIVILLGALVAWYNTQLFGLDPILATGVFCGGLTNTPALAAANEFLQGNPDAYKLTIGYSVAYPLGVILPILWSQYIAKRKNINLEHETKRAERQSGSGEEPPATINVVAKNPEILGKTLGEVMPPQAIASRLKRYNQITIPNSHTRIQAEDIYHIVATKRTVEKLRVIFGGESLQPGPESYRGNIDFRRIMLSNPELAGRTLRELELYEGWEGVVTRVRRGDTDFVPTAETRLERGDRLRVVASSEKMEAITKLLGDRFKSIAEADYFSFAAGILLGLIIGYLPIPLGGGLSVKLGIAGGPMLVGLVLGYLGRTGNVYWSMPLNTNLTLRQLGLVLFFSVVGIKAGGGFMDAIATNGWQLILAGALVTLTMSVGILFGCMKILKMDWVSATGTLGGAQTQPAILSYIGELSQSESPNAAYATIMPVAMLLKILLAQLLLFALL
jgi:putative transport protein